MKKTLLICMACLLLVSASCGNQSEAEPTNMKTTETTETATTEATQLPVPEPPLIGLDYDRTVKLECKWAEDYFKQDAIDFKFPQLTNMRDANKQKNINQFISAYVMKLITGYNGSSLEEIDFLNVQYRIALQTPDILSIVFEGNGQAFSARPWPYVEAITFDINTFQVLELSDFIPVGDELFEKLLTSKRQWFTDGQDSDYSLDSLLEKEFYGNGPHAPFTFYVTPNSIVFLTSPNAAQFVWIEVPLEG